VKSRVRPLFPALALLWPGLPALLYRASICACMGFNDSHCLPSLNQGRAFWGNWGGSGTEVGRKWDGSGTGVRKWHGSEFVVKKFCYRCSICCSSFPGTPLLLLLLAMGVLKAAVKKGPVKTYPCGTPCVKWIHYAPAHSAKRPWRVQVTGMVRFLLNFLL